MSAAAKAWLAPLLIGLGVYIVALAGARALLNDGDTLSHIAIGQWMLEHRVMPSSDVFTHTLPGGVWVPHEWLSEIIFATVYGRLGWGGVVAIAGLAVAAAFAVLTQALARSLGPRRAIIGSILAFLLTEGHFLARPHALALPLLVVWMAGVIAARDRNRVPSYRLLPVMILWCNLHGGFVVGLAFAGLLAVEAALQAKSGARLAAVRGWGRFLIAATASALLSPNGFALFLLPLRLLGMHFALSSISEWQGVDFQQWSPLELWIALAILGGFTLGARLPWTRTLILLLLLHLALTHVRNQELLGIVAPLLIAAPLAAQLRDAPPPAQARAWGPSALVAAFAVLCFLAGASILDRRGLQPPGAVAPAAALAAAREAGLDGPVLNSVRFGGYLMLEGVPDFVDGRADLFGDQFIARYVAAANGAGGLPALLETYHIGWTLFEPQSPAARQLDRLPGWTRLYADDKAVIHRRKSPAAGLAAATSVFLQH
jgi:hypothetical protein